TTLGTRILLFCSIDGIAVECCSSNSSSSSIGNGLPDYYGNIAVYQSQFFDSWANVVLVEWLGI
ncbi:hypothetical protein BGZ50_008987, partial [Haplosporangium sp. Z 11]